MNKREAVVTYGTALALCLLIMTATLELWRADLHLPLSYYGDEIVNTVAVKTMIENGWYWRNDRTGLPDGTELYDFPFADTLPMLAMKFLSLWSSNPTLLINAFYLLCYPLITFSALYVLRQFGISAAGSVAGSLLYTFLPFHFISSTGHLFLSAYYLVPLGILLSWWIATGELWEAQQSLRENLRSRRCLRRLAVGCVVCVSLGLSGVYFPFFTCFLLFVAGAVSFINRRDVKSALTACVFALVICGMTAANFVPSLLYVRQRGDVGVARRNISDADFYGLRIAQMLLPITEHKIPQLAEVKNTYNRATPPNEGGVSALGAMGSIGFLLLLAWLFFYRLPARHEIKQSPGDSTTEETKVNEAKANRAKASRVLDCLSTFNLAAVLLGTVGGFSSLFALLISSQVRVYYRISLFIAFLSLAALMIAVDHIRRAYTHTLFGRVTGYAVLALLLIFGLLDQKTARFIPDYEGVKANYLADAEFFQSLETRLPAETMIFQLPYVPFPGAPRIHRMTDYSHFRPYLHTNSLRWSYGAIRDRESDIWQKELSTKSLEEMTRTLAFAGFGGIYVDRFAYEDNAAELEKELQNLIGTQPLVGNEGRFAFFDMQDFTAHLRTNFSDAEWQARHDAALLPPLTLLWRGGFLDMEEAAGERWRWCAKMGELRLVNSSPQAKRVRLQMNFATGYKEMSRMRIGGDILLDTIEINNQPKTYTKVVTVPPGVHAITFESNARQVEAPLDPRVLIWRVINFEYEDLDAPGR